MSRLVDHPLSIGRSPPSGGMDGRDTVLHCCLPSLSSMRSAKIAQITILVSNVLGVDPAVHPRAGLSGPFANRPSGPGAHAPRCDASPPTHDADPAASARAARCGSPHDAPPPRCLPRGRTSAGARAARPVGGAWVCLQAPGPRVMRGPTRWVCPE